MRTCCILAEFVSINFKFHARHVFSLCYFILMKLIHTAQLWNIKSGWGSRPDIHVDKGHTDDITGLRFSTDGLVLLSRSMDSTLKVVFINTYLIVIL